MSKLVDSNYITNIEKTEHKSNFLAAVSNFQPYAKANIHYINNNHTIDRIS